MAREAVIGGQREGHGREEMEGSNTGGKKEESLKIINEAEVGTS